MPFGVELPDNIGSTPAPEAAPTGSEAAAGSGTPGESGGWEGDNKVSAKGEQSQATKDFLDLDKLERFRFAGREWSPKDLKNAYLRHEDYTRKTQELSQERASITEARKYSDNFSADLQAVIDNPSRISEFRDVYPKAYVDAALKILERVQGTGAAPQAGSKPQANDPLLQKVSSLEDKLTAIQEEKRQGEVKQIESWLNNTFQTLEKKYPMANSELITARAEVLAKQKEAITEEVLERLFKKNHEEIQASWDKIYKGKVQEQIKAGSKAKDTGAGGGIPGEAPRKFKNFKEATAAAIEDLSRR